MGGYLIMKKSCCSENIKDLVILNLTADLQRLLGSLRNSVRGRFQIKFGMTSLLNKNAFTLIELLVVVLIIGILAAIALPQYQKAVEKARLAEALTRIPAIEKAMDLWALEHGYSEVSFFGKTAVDSDINIESGLQEHDVYTDTAFGGAFEYHGYCSTRGSGSGYNSGNVCYYILNSSNGYALEGERGEGQNQWSHYCEYDEDSSRATAICTQLYAQGWERGDLFY